MAFETRDLMVDVLALGADRAKKKPACGAPSSPACPNPSCQLSAGPPPISSSARDLERLTLSLHEALRAPGAV